VYYANVTGILRGRWHRILESSKTLPIETGERIPVKVTEMKVVSAYMNGMNITYRDTITGNYGKFTLELNEMHKNTTIQFVHSTLTIANTRGTELYKTHLQGIHFPAVGQVILTSSTPHK
jgi:hypothetical protein